MSHNQSTFCRLNILQVFNFQRIPLLTIALGESPPNPADIYQAMQDRVRFTMEHSSPTFAHTYADTPAVS